MRLLPFSECRNELQFCFVAVGGQRRVLTIIMAAFSDRYKGLGQTFLDLLKEVKTDGLKMNANRTNVIIAVFFNCIDRKNIKGVN